MFTDRACFIYTSGTTGLPKACTIRHVRYFTMQAAMRLCADISSDDIIYCTLPLYHTSGGVLSTGQMLFTGATLVIRKKFSASNFWQDCIKYKCTVSYIIICIKNLRRFSFYLFLLLPPPSLSKGDILYWRAMSLSLSSA